MFVVSLVFDDLLRYVDHFGEIFTYYFFLFKKIFMYIYKYIFIFIYLAVLGLSCGMRDLRCHVWDLRCGVQDLLVAACGLI